MVVGTILKDSEDQIVTLEMIDEKLFLISGDDKIIFTFTSADEIKDFSDQMLELFSQ